MTTVPDIDRAPGRMRKSVLGVLLATVLLATVATFFAAHRYFEVLETKAASNQMVLYLRALNETLRQHQHLPFVLAHDPRYSDTLDPAAVDAGINARLLELSIQAKLEAIYLMDASGVVLAASNAGQPNSFLGQNYGFRPYFKEALMGTRSDYFAIGATSGRPGYFVAEPVRYARGTRNGVIAIKLDVSELQRAWESDTETVVAVNRDNIIVLASNPAWLYRPIAALDAGTKQTILDSRQFGAQPLEPLDWTWRSDTQVAVGGARYIAATGAADWRDWSVVYLRPEAAVTRQTLLATGVFGSIVALLLGFATFLRSRRIELAYAASERGRAALSVTNRELEKAQTELARTAKLSALGHMAASVTHELGQPISAFRNHLAAAEMGGEITSPSTAKSLNNLVERMEDITKQFRHFARGRVDAKARVDLADVMAEVRALLDSDLTQAGITLTDTPSRGLIHLEANKILLEQALMNLLKNAIYAVQDVADPLITLSITPQPDTVDIRISDNGPGLQGATLDALQEPFFSSKPSGVGMGLGLAITTEIIKDHGGTLATPQTTKGATFVVTLPRLPEGEPR